MGTTVHAVQSTSRRFGYGAGLQGREAGAVRRIRASTPRLGRQGQPLLHRNVQRFRGGLVFKAHRLLYLSTLGSRVIKKTREVQPSVPLSSEFGTYTTVKTRFWPWLSGKSPVVPSLLGSGWGLSHAPPLLDSRLDQIDNFQALDLPCGTLGFRGSVHLFDLFVPGGKYSYLWKSSIARIVSVI